MALSVTKVDLLPIEVLHCGNRILDLIWAPMTLTFIKWTSYTNLTRIHCRCIVWDVGRWTSYVKVSERYHL